MAERIYETISREQLQNVLAEVHLRHEWPMQGRRIKYIDMHYDTRSSSVFTITFRDGVQVLKEFTSTNRFNAKSLEMEDVRLYREVMDWLAEGENVHQPKSEPHA